MPHVPLMLLSLLQTVTPGDTLVARLVSDRGLWDWTSGILQLVVLVLGIGSLATMVWLLVTVQRGVHQVNEILRQFATESRPLIAAATAVVTDAREVVAMLRTDAERVTDAASAISGQLLDAAETTAQRVDDVNAVLDVLQDELEDTALAAVAAVRGARVGAERLAQHVGRRGKSRDADAP